MMKWCEFERGAGLIMLAVWLLMVVPTWTFVGVSAVYDTPVFAIIGLVCVFIVDTWLFIQLGTRGFFDWEHYEEKWSKKASSSHK